MLILLTAFAAPAARAACVTIKAGTLNYSTGYLAGQPLKVGFDAYGYNYQAHLFNGSIFNAYANAAGFPPYDGDDAAYLTTNPTAPGNFWWQYRSVTLNMKWNEAWLSNQDCTGDSKLDRHLGFATYIGSGAWLTNHQSDTYEDGIHWTYFIKIVAVPSTAVPSAGVWYTSDGSEIGWSIWGEFATIQEVYNDPAYDAHGILYKSPTNPGFGYWGNQ
jgi:hypothetical protein